MKNRKSALVLFVAVLGVICLAPAPMMAQGCPDGYFALFDGRCVPMPKGKCVQDCDEGRPGRSDSGRQRKEDPEKARIEAKKEKAHALNEEGVAAWNRGEWDVASEKFREANAWNPDSKVILNNCLNVAHQLGLIAIEKGNWDYAYNIFNGILGYKYKSILKESQRLEFQRFLVTCDEKRKEQGKKWEELRRDNRQFNKASAQNNLGRLAAEKGDYALAETYFVIAAEIYPAEPVFLQNVAWARTKQGDQAWRNDDESTALSFWKKALEADPQNVARERLLAWQIAEDKYREKLRLKSIAEDEKHREQERLAQKNSDPMVVDTRNVSSGLPKSVEDAIVDVYQNAPPGVSGWVRKGFQAVMVKDWKVAKACLGSALLLDPENSGLKRLIAITEHVNGAPDKSTPDSIPVAKNSSPDKAEIDQFFKDFRAGQRSAPSEQVRRYVLSLSDEEFKQLLWDLKPQDSDMEYLFDLNKPLSR